MSLKEFCRAAIAIVAITLLAHIPMATAFILQEVVASLGDKRP